jgi:hypothetical protein
MFRQSSKPKTPAGTAASRGSFNLYLAQLKLPNRMIPIERAPYRIDLLNELTKVDFDAAWERRKDG